MSVTVSYGSLISFLDGRLDHSPPAPTAEPTGLCLLAGGIVGRNLEDALARREIPTGGIELSTIEDTATDILDSHYRRHADDPDSVTVLDQQLCEQLLIDIITNAADSDSLNAVTDLLSGFDWAGRPTLRERLWNELDRYFRMTDAGSDHAAAVDVAVELADSDPYAGTRSRQALTAFKTLHTALQQRTDELPETTYLSRSHLVAAARQRLAAEWRACYPVVDWVAVDTISVLDNPTLRFFETLATLEDGPDLYVFGTEAGAGPTLAERLRSAGLDPTLVHGDDGNDQPHVSALLSTTEGEPPETIPNTEFIEAPDRRRELEYVAGQIRALTGMVDSDSKDETTSTCGEIVVAAKDVIGYRSRIADVFTDHSIPYHIEARQPLMQTVPYRYLRAIFDLLAAVADNESITTQALVDPLRLGFCPPDATGEWPVDGHAVTEIERRLEAVDTATTEDGQSFDDWIETVRSEFAGGELPAVHRFIEWVDETAANPPQSAEQIVELIDALLSAHLAPQTRSGVQRPHGPGVDGTRIALTTKHDSHAIRRLRDHADRVSNYIKRAATTDLGDLGWKLAATAVATVCGSGSYWPTNSDGNAVRFVNAANAHFVDADYVFVLGLAAEEFPAERTPPAFFHDAFYKRVRETARETVEEHAAAYLHAPTNEAQFEGDTDEYRAAITAASKGVWCCRRYTNQEGEAIPWSGFVDAYISQADEEIQRISTDEWLPTADSEGDWKSAIRTATPRDRLRLLSATFPDGVRPTKLQPSGSLTDRDGVVELLSRADGDAYSREIEPRRQRYVGEDIRSITVRPDEAVVFDDQSLNETTGSPIRSHELDLYTNCELKFYHYQYLNSGGADRDCMSELPTVLQDRYPSAAFTDGLRRLITSADRLWDRQAAFGAFDSLGAFRDQLVSWIETDPVLTDALIQPMLGEYLAVDQELAAGLSREWRWEPATTITIDGHAVSVPGHRVDYVPKYEFSIPVWYTAADGAAERLVRQSLTPTDSGVRDHRLLFGAETADTFGGTLVCDPTSAADSARHGFLIGDLNPIPESVPQESNLRRVGRAEWRETRNQWREATANRLGSMTATDKPITYRVSESFVDNGGCIGCDYRDLCGVPASRRRGQQ